MEGFDKIELAQDILEEDLGDLLENILFDFEIPRFTATLVDRTKIIIRYNNYDEYAYFIIFSESLLDRCLFDNYDQRWEVESSPHHFHPRFSKPAFSSPMNGNPELDIRLLCELIQSGSIFSSDLRF
ncbi:MAG TPA: hypothetical protein VKK79_08200 [Candidatus Lokiarchaeia archaeon]|nr:hypothetical protein [Candidatus Lokiarchaeia archaeon]